MRIWAIVPVKPFRLAKSRLALALDANQRECAQSRQFLTHVLRVLNSLPQIERTVVVSRDPAALHLARDEHAFTLQEQGEPNLNHALQLATRWAKAFHVNAVLFYPATCLNSPRQKWPCYCSRATIRWCRLCQIATVPVPMPCLVRPPGLLHYQFGLHSLQAHLAQADTQGAEVHIFQLPSIAFDVDEPHDLTLAQHNYSYWTY
jgi:2-phospho-L-lactate guanylyltransferase